jgi:hypothetical protein
MSGLNRAEAPGSADLMPACRAARPGPSRQFRPIVSWHRTGPSRAAGWLPQFSSASAVLPSNQASSKSVAVERCCSSTLTRSNRDYHSALTDR